MTPVIMAVLGLLAGAIRAAQAEPAGKIIVFHAGSLAAPMKEIREAFSRERPQVAVFLEAAGSRACARKIADLGLPCDVFASSDYRVIDDLLIPTHATWNILFAGNEMTIAFTEKSRCADGINSDNWRHLLLRPEIIFGRADPDSDPCGYRTVMTLKLAETRHGEPGLCDRFLKKDVRFIRPKETDLLALLETGAIDYLFVYRSVAVQHGLKFVSLPDEINLRNPAYSCRYAAVEVEVTGSKPGTTAKERGAPISYGVTVPLNAPNKAAALAFAAFLLSKEKGLAILERNGQQSIVPSPTRTYDAVPDELKKFASRGNQ